jgi:hypothetical protein
MADDDDLPPDADAIYGLPLEDFVPERAAVAKRLRSEGDREMAKRVTTKPGTENVRRTTLGVSCCVRRTVAVSIAAQLRAP